MKTNCGSSPESITKTTSNSEVVVDGIVMRAKEDFDRLKYVYAPNSIWHGMPRQFMDEKLQLKIASGRIDDFLEWLFDRSGYIDFISQSEAWDEFEKWENEPA